MVAGKFGRGNTLILEILPGAVTGWGDMQLKDTTEFKWSTFESTDLAELVSILTRMVGLNLFLQMEQL